jgi:hypothetical protein
VYSAPVRGWVQAVTQGVSSGLTRQEQSLSASRQKARAILVRSPLDLFISSFLSDEKPNMVRHVQTDLGCR